MLKKIIIGVVIAALIAGGSVAGGRYYRNTHQTTVGVISVSQVLDEYSSSDSILDGTITASAQQNITLDDDMIIEQVYVTQGEDVKKGDPLIEYDLTLVQMELNIARLELEQEQKNLAKAEKRLAELKNGAALNSSDGVSTSVNADNLSSSNSETGSSSQDPDMNLTSSVVNINGSLLSVAVAEPILVAEDPAKDVTPNESPAETSTSGTAEQINPQNEENGVEVYSDVGSSGDSDDFSDGSEESEEVVVTDNSSQPTNEIGNTDFTDSEVTFYETLDRDSSPFTGTGTQEDPFVFICSTANGYVKIMGSFLNKMAGYAVDGTKEKGQSYWYQIEFQSDEFLQNLTDRQSYCQGYLLVNGQYLPDGSELDHTLGDFSSVNLDMSEVSQYENTDNTDEEDMDGDFDEGSSTETTETVTVTREEAIKSWETQIDSYKIDMRKTNLEISKLEKKLNNETVYSKMDGTVTTVGDADTRTSNGNYFLVVKSSDGFYVTGSVSELLLDDMSDGTVLQCSSDMGSFEAEVIDVAEYPTDSTEDTYYYGSGNPNVSYYSYTASISDKSLQFSDNSWVSVTLPGSSDSDDLIIDKSMVRSENGKYYAYVDDNGTLKKQMLEVGGNVDSGYGIIIKSGLSMDDKIAFPYGDDVQEGAKTRDMDYTELWD